MKAIPTSILYMFDKIDQTWKSIISIIILSVIDLLLY